MFDNLKNKIFCHSVRREVSELYISIAIKTLAVSMIAIFEPIFLYNIYHSIRWVIFFYVIVYGLNFFLLPLGGKFASRYGFEHGILASIPILIVYLLLLYQIKNYHILFFIAPFALAAYKSIYWASEHADLAHYGHSCQRGAELSFMYCFTNLISIIGPFIGGFIIAIFSFKILFLVVSFIMFCSAFPLFTTKEEFTPSHLSYFKAIRRFFKPYGTYTTRAKILFMGYGSDFAAMICWPIFIFLAVQSYKVIGGLITLSLLITSVISLIIGKAIDKKEGDKVVKTSVILYFFIWIFRYFFPTAAGVFFIDFLDRNISQGIFIPARAFIYSEGKKRGFLKYIIFSEMGISFAKAIIGILIIILLSFINSWFIIFLVTGFVSLFYLALPSEKI